MSAPIRTARELRQQMTPEEKMLWKELRNKRFHNKKFRRQHPIIYGQEGWRKYFYVADFIVPFTGLLLNSMANSMNSPIIKNMIQPGILSCSTWECKYCGYRTAK